MRWIGTFVVAAGLLIQAGCTSGQKKHERITIESQGVPHTGYYDAHGMWHGGFYDAERRYHEDDPKWGQTHDPEWNANFANR